MTEQEYRKAPAYKILLDSDEEARAELDHYNYPDIIRNPYPAVRRYIHLVEDMFGSHPSASTYKQEVDEITRRFRSVLDDRKHCHTDMEARYGAARKLFVLSGAGMPAKEGGEVVRHIHTRVQPNWLYRWIQDRIKNDVSISIVIVGPRGFGKSFSSLQVLWHSQHPSIENVVFDGVDYIDRFNALGEGDVLILDDAGMAIGSRDFKEDINKVFGVIQQTGRYKKIVSIITVPHISFIDSQPRALIDILLEASDREKGLFYAKKVTMDEKRKLHIDPYEESIPSGYVVIDSIKFPLPLDFDFSLMAEEYENKKETMMEAWRQYQARIFKALKAKKDMEIELIEKQSRIVELRQEGLSYREIAGRLDVSPQYVGRTLKKVR
jgi:hypothetical protein